MSKVRTTRPTCHHGNLHRAGYCKASQPLHKDARWSRIFESNAHQFSCSFSLALSNLACQMLPNSILFRYGNLLFSWEKDKSMPLWSLVHMLCHQHLVLAPQRDFFALNLQIRQIFTRSSFDHGIPASSTRCTALSPATPISPNAISHLQNTQRQKSMNLCQCPKMSEISKSPKDSAPPPLWPRMPWARKYFRCMPLQRGKQENIRDICADSRYSYDFVTKGNEIPSSHWLGMKRQGSTLHIQSNGFFEIWNIMYF